MENKGIIYILTSLDTGKQYVGQTRQLFKDRMRFHKNTAFNKNNSLYNLTLYQDVRKYGWDQFSQEIIEENIEIAKLNGLETKYIKEYKTLEPNGYNTQEVACVPVEVPQKKKDLLSKIARERIANMSEENRKEYFANIERGRKENPLSEDSKQKISESLKKYNEENEVSSDTRDKMSQSRKKRGHQYPTYMTIRIRSNKTEYIINRHPKCRYKSFSTEEECLEYLNELNSDE